MVHWQLRSADDYGAIVVHMLLLAAASDGFQNWRPIASLEDFLSIAVAGSEVDGRLR